MMDFERQAQLEAEVSRLKWERDRAIKGEESLHLEATLSAIEIARLKAAPRERPAILRRIDDDTIHVFATAKLKDAWLEKNESGIRAWGAGSYFEPSDIHWHGYGEA